MGSELPTWVSRVAALALFFGLLAFIVFLTVPPVLRNFDANRETIQFNRDAIARFERIAATLPALKKQLAALEARSRSRRHYLSGATPALAAADLQKHVQNIAKANGGTVSSIQILKSEKEDDFERIAIRIQLRATIESIRDIFYNLEAGQPYLFIDNLEIRTRSTRRRRGGKVAADPLLVVGFQLYGYGRAAGDGA